MQRRLMTVDTLNRFALVGACWLYAVGATAADVACDPAGAIDVGPFDYRQAPADRLAMVEKFHFTSDVQLLRKGASAENIGKDLEFVLRYFPNHSRALTVLVQLAKREKTNKPRGMRESVECLFLRAVSFRPNDATVNLQFSLWLSYRGDKDGARTYLKAARDSATRSDANFIYNLGLASLEVGDYESALESAHKAYALGYPLPGLRDRLIRLNKWSPPDVSGTHGAVAPNPGSGGTTDPRPRR